ncbi:helix-turn-helix transcriptional regulator [bacterium]|nr:helix-turn-helix transcriptional regulator [bacterium]
MDKEFKKLNIEEINNILPQKLKHFREQAGLSLREVAKKIDKSPGQVSLWEKGVNPPSCIDLFKLCIIYDIMLPDLFPGIYKGTRPVKQEIELVKKYRAADPEVKITIQKILDYTTRKE